MAGQTRFGIAARRAELFHGGANAQVGAHGGRPSFLIHWGNNGQLLGQRQRVIATPRQRSQGFKADVVVGVGLNRRTSAASKAAWDSSTSVMATKPTSKRCCACSSWRLTAVTSALVVSSRSRVRRIFKYASATRTIRSCSWAAKENDEALTKALALL